MKVYPVVYSEYDGAHMACIFSTKAAAEEYAELSNKNIGAQFPRSARYDVEEFEVIEES